MSESTRRARTCCRRPAAAVPRARRAGARPPRGVPGREAPRLAEQRTLRDRPRARVGGRSASASVASSRARSGSSSKTRKRPASCRPSRSADSSPVARSAASPGSISGSPSAKVRYKAAAHARSSAANPPVAPAIPMRSSTTPSSVNASRDAAAVVERDAERDGKPRMQLMVVRAAPRERGAQLGIEREHARPDGVGRRGRGRPRRARRGGRRAPSGPLAPRLTP